MQGASDPFDLGDIKVEILYIYNIIYIYIINI